MSEKNDRKLARKLRRHYHKTSITLLQEMFALPLKDRLALAFRIIVKH